MTIYFLHGLESGPDGLKIQQMRQVTERLGLTSVAPDFRGISDPQQRVQQVLTQLAAEDAARLAAGLALLPLVLVGSSLGGFVAAELAAKAPARVIGLLLLCPAFDLQGYPLDRPQQNLRGDAVQIIHGRHDTVVPLANSLRAAADWQASVLIVEDEHPLHDSVAQICGHLQAWLLRLLPDRSEPGQ